MVRKVTFPRVFTCSQTRHVRSMFDEHRNNPRPLTLSQSERAVNEVHRQHARAEGVSQSHPVEVIGPEREERVAPVQLHVLLR